MGSIARGHINTCCVSGRTMGLLFFTAQLSNDKNPYYFPLRILIMVNIIPIYLGSIIPYITPTNQFFFSRFNEITQMQPPATFLFQEMGAFFGQ